MGHVMDRSVGITICAVTAFIGSVLTLVYGAFNIRQLEVAAAWFPFTKESMLLSGCLSFAAGVCGVATAFGLLNHREWARISMLAFGWLCLVFCLLPMFIYPWVTLPRFAHLFVMGFFPFFVGIGSWWLYFFSKKSVKEQFAENAKVGEASQSTDAQLSKRPPSISIVAWYLLITAFIFATTSSDRMLTYAFSWSEMRLVNVAYVLVHVCAFVGLLELKPWSRILAAGYFSLLIVAILASMWISADRFGFAWLMSTAPVSLGLGWFVTTGHSLLTSYILAVPLLVLPLGVLLKQKRAFVRG
jgi:hypothetical protein